MHGGFQPAAAHLSRAPTSTSRGVWNVVSNWGGFALTGLVNFTLAPFVVHHLGNRYYGITILLLSVTGYLGLLDLGVCGATTRYVAKFHSQLDHESSSRFVSSALGLFAFLGGLAILLCSGLAVFARAAAPISQGDLAWVRILLVLIGLNIAVSLVSGVFSGIPMALQKFYPVNVVGVLMNSLRALAIVVALWAGGGLLTVVTIQLGSTVAATLAIVWVTRKLYPELQMRWNRFDREHVRLVLSYSMFSFTLLVSDAAFMFMNSAIVGIFLSASLVTFLAIASTLVACSRELAEGIAKTSTPQASALEAQGDSSAFRRALVSGAGYATMLVLPMAVTFLIRGKSFIGLWMGPEYAGLCGQVLGILTLGLIFSAGNQVTLATVLGVSKHKSLVPFFLGQALCNLILGVFLVRVLGLVGVAWATTLPYLAMSLFFWPWYVRRVFGIPIRNYVWTVWVQALIAVAPFAWVTWMVEMAWPAPNLPVFFLQTAAALPFALIGFWYFCVPHAQRRALLPVLQQPARELLWMPTKGTRLRRIGPGKTVVSETGPEVAK